MPGKLTRSELICVVLTAVFAALALGLTLGASGGGGVTVGPSALGAAPAPSASPEAGSGRIDLNSATAEELCLLPGIGPVRAEAIVAYREENGPFRQTADIMNVRGIGQATFDKLKDYITAGEVS